MNNINTKLPHPFNEKIKEYKEGSLGKKLLLDELEKQKNQVLNIPLIIGGKPVFSGNTGKAICPHNHKHILANYEKAGEKEVHLAIEAAMKVRKSWSEMPFSERAAIFLKAAELVSNKYTYILNAATMLNQSKNPHQAEIDSTCELADFFRFNVSYAEQIINNQPAVNGISEWNQIEYRSLEGFVFAVTPFNFTAIGGNLPTAPAIMGNVVLWKPASTSVLSSYYIMQLLKEAGLPDGVINFLPGSGSTVGNPALQSQHFAGLHFTGSTGVFNNMWKTIGENMGKYKTYPRIVGETGGKDFIFAHHSAEIKSLTTAMVKGAFEFQGQKCSAASRAYIPESLWKETHQHLKVLLEKINKSTGDPTDFKFYNAVIDQKSYDNTMKYIETAKNSKKAEIVFGGNGDDSIGYFIQPTVILTSDPHFITMEEEIFGPVLTLYIYPDNDYEKTLKMCDSTSVYALTGAIFATDRHAIITAKNILNEAAGNFYINDKPSGAVVGQQPFGGARKSGTNDKAGSWLNLTRWTSVRTVKENFFPAMDLKYGFTDFSETKQKVAHKCGCKNC